VKTPQRASELILTLDDVDIESLCCQFESGRHPAYPATNDKSILVHLELAVLEWLEKPCFAHGHANKILRFRERLFGFILVNPRILIPNIRKLEQIRIHTRLTDRTTEKRFMRTGCAGCHHNSIELVLLNHVGDGGNRVLGTCVQQVIRIDDVLQLPSVFRYGCGIDHSSNVLTAVAYENTNCRILTGNITFRRIFLFLGSAPFCRGKQCLCSGRCSTRLHHCFRYVLGFIEGSTREYAFSGGVHRRQTVRFAETVFVQFNTKSLRKIPCPHRRIQTTGKNRHAEQLLLKIARFVNIRDNDILGIGNLFNSGGSASNVSHALILSPLVVFVKPLAISSHVDIEDGAI